jgi:hypothetical protein
MANTVIQLKYSTVTSTPTTLNVAEPAYSFTSDKLFIGNNTGTVLTIGGKYYVDIIDAATASSTVNTVVKRDAQGNAAFNGVTANSFTGAHIGNSTTATTWQTARLIGVSGDATGQVSVDGSANANVPLTLNSTGVAAGTYGGATQIPTFAVDAKGRVTSAANVAIATTLNIAGDTGTDALSLLTDTVTFYGRDGLTSNVIASNNAVIFDVDNTVIRTTGNQGITGDLTVTGNLNVTGTQVIVNTTTVQTNDSLIKLANNNISGDVLDIGFYGSSNTGSAVAYHGLIREGSGGGANAGKFYLFKNLNVDPTSNVVVYANTTRADLITNITGGTVSGLTAAVVVADGGTGATSFTNGAIVIGQGTGALTTLANTTYVQTGTLAASATLTGITVDAYGRFTGSTAANIAIGTTQITSGTLPIARGGTNQTSWTTGQRVVYDGTSLASQANTTTTPTGTLSAATTLTALTYNSYGEITAYTSSNIAIGTTQITSGTLGVDRGGIGVATLTTNGVLLGQGTSAVTTASSSTQGHVLTINASGVPTFSHLSGGTF